MFLRTSIGPISSDSLHPWERLARVVCSSLITPSRDYGWSGLLNLHATRSLQSSCLCIILRGIEFYSCDSLKHAVMAVWTVSSVDFPEQFWLEFWCSSKLNLLWTARRNFFRVCLFDRIVFNIVLYGSRSRPSCLRASRIFCSSQWYLKILTPLDRWKNESWVLRKSCKDGFQCSQEVVATIVIIGRLDLFLLWRHLSELRLRCVFCCKKIGVDLISSWWSQSCRHSLLEVLLWADRFLFVLLKNLQPGTLNFSGCEWVHCLSKTSMFSS